MKRTLTTIMVAALLAACGGQELETPDYQAMRAGGKADGFVDVNLSCKGSCGSLAVGFSGYCACDDLCTKYGDCCTDKAKVCDGDTSDVAACKKIDAAYQQALVTASACTADADCGKFVGGTLSCGIPTKAINTTMTGQVTSLRGSWTSAGCHKLDWNCPLLAPLPPWMKVRGVCEQGTCKAEYYDTRGAKEGDACGSDINVECGDGLYCAFGLNWCGTPPVTGVCRKLGDCGAVSDCNNPNNSWIHPMCVGQATCESGTCGWDCGL